MSLSCVDGVLTCDFPLVYYQRRIALPAYCAVNTLLQGFGCVPLKHRQHLPVTVASFPDVLQDAMKSVAAFRVRENRDLCVIRERQSASASEIAASRGKGPEALMGLIFPIMKATELCSLKGSIEIQDESLRGFIL